VRIAAKNVRQNRLAGKLCFQRADLTHLPLRPKRRYDVICANLTSDLLVAQEQRIRFRVKRGGQLILAGILRTEGGLVRRVYERSGWKVVAHAVEGEWESLAISAPARTFQL
jgi:ribosomal protein L11 methylase PrmA